MKSTKDSIAFLPLDNRPVSYLLLKQIADFAGVDLILPERKYLGDLNCGSDLEYIHNWYIRDIAFNISTLIVSLDNFVYGGLVQSRKHDFTLDELKKRVNVLAEGKVSESSLQNVYAFSSIMRIPDYDDSDEEKEYWKNYGKKLFRWSELTHKVGRGVKEEGYTPEKLLEDWYTSSKEIPPDILADFKSHRDKNLTVNLRWIESLHKDFFSCLVFSCDDSGSYGMNVVEAEYIKKEIKKHDFLKKAYLISGTDEIPLLLFSKALIKNSLIKPKVSLYFNSTHGMNQKARYESNTIRDSVLNQIKLLEIEITDPDNADILLCIHSSDSLQGDHIFKIPTLETRANVIALTDFISKSDKPFIISDLAYANGSDPELIKSIIDSKINLENCYGYAGWNTSSNSTGTAISSGVIRYISEKQDKFNKSLFKEFLLTRFLDDYAYQTQIRHSKITEEELNEKMEPYIKIFSNLLNIVNVRAVCSLPWKRSFETEINLLR